MTKMTAFPCTYLDRELQKELRLEFGTLESLRRATITSPGMSLRDYFAIHAGGETATFSSLEVASSITGVPLPEKLDDRGIFEFRLQVAAVLRYRIADAMLKAREQNQND